MTTETWLDEDTTWFSNETDADRGDNSTSIVDAVGLNFVDSFVKALTAMLVSELGDKTFFLAGEESNILVHVSEH
jgi:putative Ca2+/H+ antiporter (TMEM165/GDT1 family)